MIPLFSGFCVFDAWIIHDVCRKFPQCPERVCSARQRERSATFEFESFDFSRLFFANLSNLLKSSHDDVTHSRLPNDAASDRFQGRIPRFVPGASCLPVDVQSTKEVRFRPLHRSSVSLYDSVDCFPFIPLMFTFSPHFSLLAPLLAE